MAFYVAPDGDDRHSGTRDRPFATLTRARDAAREARAGGPKRIIVRGGAYYDVCLVLTPEDSGLSIEGAAGETAILYGGKPVTEWEQEDGGFYAARLPGVKNGEWDFRLLLVDGSVRPRSRLPEEGRFTHLSRFDVSWVSTSGGGWARKPTETELTTLTYSAADLGPWFDVDNAELTLYHEWDESFVGVRAIDHERQTLTFSSPACYPPGAFGKDTYVVWNLREGMHRAGQWYLDRTAGKLVYWPLEGEDVTAIRAIVPTTESVVSLRGDKDEPVVGVTLENLAIQCTTTPLAPGGWAAAHYAGAVHGEYTRDCRLLGLRIANVGGQGIFFADSDNPLADGCEVRATGAGGIYFCGAGGVIANSHLHHIGEAFPSGIGIRVIGSGHVIRHNEIHDTSYCGIEGGSSQARIEYNRIYDFMQVLNDGGAIYNSFNGVANPCEDVVIRRNMVFYQNARPRDGSHAYYLDERSVNCVIEENLAIDTGWPCQLHMTQGCSLRNNVFIDDGDTKLTFPRSQGVRLQQNVVYARGAIRADRAEWKDNLLFSATGKYENIPDDQTRADPLFVDWKNGKYNFRADSPAVTLGIEPVDAREAGRNFGDGTDN